MTFKNANKLLAFCFMFYQQEALKSNFLYHILIFVDIQTLYLVITNVLFWGFLTENNFWLVLFASLFIYFFFHKSQILQSLWVILFKVLSLNIISNYQLLNTFYLTLLLLWNFLYIFTKQTLPALYMFSRQITLGLVINRGLVLFPN